MATPTCPRCGNHERVTRHMTPPGLYAREEGYRCNACEYQDSRYITDADYDAFRASWNDAPEPVTYEQVRDSVARQIAAREERDREFTWPTENPDGTFPVSTKARRAELLEEHYANTSYWFIQVGADNKLEHSHHGRLPQNAELRTTIRTWVEDDAPRAQYAAWLRAQSDPRGPVAAGFIEEQLAMAAQLRADPRADVHSSLTKELFEQHDRPCWWRYHGYDGMARARADELTALIDEGIIDDLQWYRGFVEHVAIKAHRFLEVAEELYDAAPIRHLTITYAKGLDHQDRGLFARLVESPHLARVRSLRLPVTYPSNEFTELNRLTDDDIATLAASPQLRGLRYLDLENERKLTVRAFDALAASKTLTELSFVRYELQQYTRPGTFSFGSSGPMVLANTYRPLEGWAAELEERHGRIPWLHPRDTYGTDTPDIEAVVEHPVVR